MSTKSSVAKRRVGRPRLSQREHGEGAREEIIAAARSLFRTQGITATSTRQIADAVGLRQPSLFHHFPSKQTIVHAVAMGAVQPVLDFIAAERRARLPPDVALYRLIRFDTLHLCTSDAALGIISLLPELSRQQLPEFWRQRDSIIDAYGRELRRGVRGGQLVVGDRTATTHFLFGLGESTLAWYRPGSRQRAERTAATAADLALRAVLKDPARLEAVRAAALARA